MNKGLQSLVLFDFDGTITKKDSLFDIVKFTYGPFRFWEGLIRLSPHFIGFKLGYFKAQRLKEIWIQYFFGGILESEWLDLCKNYANNRIPMILNSKAIEKIEFHKSQQDRIVVVSASPEDWVKIWANSINIECIATRLEKSQGKISGRILGKNCNGLEKVHRIKEYLNPETYYPIYAYGDSNGDKEMLALSNIPAFKIF